MNIDFSACATIKGENQKPLITERLARFGRSRPSIKEIAETAIKRGLDGIVLRSFSHSEGTDNRWNEYLKQMERLEGFTCFGNGTASYISPDSEKKLVIIHGQGLMTYEGNIQVLFAERTVGKRGSKFDGDFSYLIKEARDSGENVLITAGRPYTFADRLLESVDALETWNGMDSVENNERSDQIAKRLEKPGVYVSNAKCLHDLGRSYTTLDFFGHYQSPVGIAKATRRSLNLRLDKDLGGEKGFSTLSKLVQALAIAEVKLTGNKD
ncbi:MAG: hypothetical protein AABX23_00690 [Nanoarchaeota archaeon]